MLLLLRSFNLTEIFGRRLLLDAYGEQNIDN